MFSVIHHQCNNSVIPSQSKDWEAQGDTLYKQKLCIEKKKRMSQVIFMFHFCIVAVMVRCVFREYGCLHAYDRFLPFPQGKVVVNPFDLLRSTTFVNNMCFQFSAETKEVISDSFLNSSNPWLQKWPQGMSNFHKLQQSPGIKFVLNTNLHWDGFITGRT